MLQFLRKVAPVMLALLLFGAGWYFGADHEKIKWERRVHNEYVGKIKSQEDIQKAVSEVSSRYQEELDEIQGSTDRMLDDLRINNKRLSVRIKNSTSGAEGSRGCLPNGRAELHESDAKAIIGVTKAADAHIKALQGTVRALQVQEGL